MVNLVKSEDVFFSAGASDVFEGLQRTWLARRHVLEREKERIDGLLAAAVLKSDALAVAGDDSLGFRSVRRMFDVIDDSVNMECRKWELPGEDERVVSVRSFVGRYMPKDFVVTVSDRDHSAEALVELEVAGRAFSTFWFSLCVDYGYDVARMFAAEAPSLGLERRADGVLGRG